MCLNYVVEIHLKLFELQLSLHVYCNVTIFESVVAHPDQSCI